MAERMQRVRGTRRERSEAWSGAVKRWNEGWHGVLPCGRRQRPDSNANADLYMTRSV